MLSSLQQRKLPTPHISKPHLPTPHIPTLVSQTVITKRPHEQTTHDQTTRDQATTKQPKTNIKEDAEHSDSRFSHLISVLPTGVVVVDKNGCVSLANKQAIQLLDEPLEGEKWRDVINRVFAPQADDGHEVSMRNGRRVKIDISPLSFEKGQLIVITDLTETRQLQSRVGHMQRLSSLGKMVASLAHQVRTPLSSALLYAENLKSMDLYNEMANRFSQKLTHRLKELESQVNDMLLFAKSSDQQIVKRITTQSIQEQSLAQVEAQLNQANIRLSATNTIKDHQVLGNITAISGAIANLLMNACNALEQYQLPNDSKAHVHLQTTAVTIDNNDYAMFTVMDNGPGLESANVHQLFEPFYTTKSQGTGLGLAVVNTVAKSHKGKVNCGNNAQAGAYFSLYIPLINEPQIQTARNIQHQTQNQIQNQTENNTQNDTGNVKEVGETHE